MAPYIPGCSELPDTDFQSQEAYFGMTSDEYYAATQVQRRLERNVRKLKRRVSLGQEAGFDMTADRARLGVAQGKVRDWCKTHKLPRDYARERAWGVKKQPRALAPKRSTKAAPKAKRTAPKRSESTYKENGHTRRKRLKENEENLKNNPGAEDNGHRRPINKGRRYQRDNATNFDRVESKSWAAAMKKVFGKAAEKAIGDVRHTLKVMDKKPYEQLYYYDLDTGELITSVVNQRTPHKVKLPKKGKKKVLKAIRKGHRVVSVHNHPGGSIPSGADIQAGINSGQAFGVVAGHDGSLFTYEVVGKPEVGYNYGEKSWNRALGYYITDGDGAFKDIESKWGVRIDHILTN